MGLHFIHFGMLQVGIRPLTRKGLNTSALVCALDTRHHSFKDALLGAVQAPLHDGPIYFIQCLSQLHLFLIRPPFKPFIKIE